MYQVHVIITLKTIQSVLWFSYITPRNVIAVIPSHFRTVVLKFLVLGPLYDLKIRDNSKALFILKGYINIYHIKN